MWAWLFLRVKCPRLCTSCQRWLMLRFKNPKVDFSSKFIALRQRKIQQPIVQPLARIVEARLICWRPDRKAYTFNMSRIPTTISWSMGILDKICRIIYYLYKWIGSSPRTIWRHIPLGICIKRLQHSVWSHIFIYVNDSKLWRFVFLNVQSIPEQTRERRGGEKEKKNVKHYFGLLWRW